MTRLNSIKDKSRAFEIEPYYGNRDFLQFRIEYIKECMEKLLKNPRFESRDDIRSYITRIDEIIQSSKTLTISNIDTILQQKMSYEQLEAYYKEVLQMENGLSKDVEAVWKETLTPTQSYSKNENFGFLAHVLTEGSFNPEDMNKVCMAYITDSTITLPYGDYGLIYPMDMSNISMMGVHDAGSWVTNKNEFIDRGFPQVVQFTEAIDANGNRIYYEYPPKISKLILPDDMEKETIQNTINSNGEMLNYDNYPSYNEVVLTNRNKNMYPSAVFVNLQTTSDNSERVEKAKKLAEEMGIPYIEIDKSLCRERHGLAPLTAKEKSKVDSENIKEQ